MLSSHLARCPDCEAYEADVTAFTYALRDVPLETPARPVVVRAPRRFVTTRLQVGAAAAVAVAVLVGAGQLMKDKPLGIQPAFGPTRTQIKYPTRQQLEREQAILERAHVGRPVQILGQVL